MKNLSESTTITSTLTDDNMTLLTADEVAHMLMVGKDRVYELLNQKKIKGMRFTTSMTSESLCSIHTVIHFSVLSWHIKRTSALI